MTSDKRVRMAAIVLAAATACCAVSPPGNTVWAQQEQPTPAATPADTLPATAPTLVDPAVIVQQDLARLAAALRDPQTRPEQRDEAARRLVSRQSRAAQQFLADALVDEGNPAGQLAAARALADSQQPDDALITPLFAMLGANRQLTEAAARALANYKSNPEVLGRLIGMVQQRRPPQAVPDAVRREIIKVLGSLVEKRAAELLVSVLRSGEEQPAIRNGAADALADMTGISEYGQDPVQWAHWWDSVSNLAPDQFRNELLPRRSAHYDQIREQYSDLSAELKNILDDQYNSAPPEKRPEIVLKNLHSPAADVRAAAATIVDDEVLNNKTPPANIKDQLRGMIGDSNWKVRKAVAGALAHLNDTEALGPLLAQLTQETDPEVRASLINALAPIGDPRAARPLIALLNSPSYATARAAAAALKQMGPRIRDNPVLAQETAHELQRAFEKLPANQGNFEMRMALLDAMSPLHQEDLRQFLIGLLQVQRDETPQIKRLAVKALGEIGNPNSTNIIAQQIEDPAPEASVVRLEAVRALGNMSNAGDYAETLRHHLDPRIERDASVREAAWKTLETIFPTLNKELLRSFADHFKDEPARRQEPLKALADKLVKEKNEDELATTRIDIGAVDMELGDYKEAAEYFKQALAYKKLHNVQGPGIVRLTEQRMKALLLSKQYPEAVAFAAEAIQSDPANQQTMGTAIRLEVDRLAQSPKPEDLNNALTLIAETQKMNPPLSPQHLEELAGVESNIRKRLTERGGSQNGGGNASDTILVQQARAR